VTRLTVNLFVRVSVFLRVLRFMFRFPIEEFISPAFLWIVDSLRSVLPLVSLCVQILFFFLFFFFFVFVWAVCIESEFRLSLLGCVFVGQSSLRIFLIRRCFPFFIDLLQVPARLLQLILLSFQPWRYFSSF